MFLRIPNHRNNRPPLLHVTYNITSHWHGPNLQRRLLGISHRSSFSLRLLLGDSGSVLVTDLALNTNKVGNVAIGITERSDEELVPEGRTIDTVVEQADRHIIALFDGLADTFDSFGIGLGTLQEAAITSQNLVERVTGKVEETLTGVDNRIVRQGGIGDNKVLLCRLEGLDEREVRIVQDLVGNALRTGKETVDTGTTALRLQQHVGLLVAEVRADRVAELLILFLQESNRLLERLEQELLADTRTLRVFTIAFTVIIIR